MLKNNSTVKRADLKLDREGATPQQTVAQSQKAQSCIDLYLEQGTTNNRLLKDLNSLHSE